MRFNVEFKIPQCDAQFDFGGGVDIDSLVEIHKMYRAWLKRKKSNPTEPYPSELHTLLNSTLGLYLSMESMFVWFEPEGEDAKERFKHMDKKLTPLDLYPGLEDQDYYSENASGGQIMEVDLSLDLDKIQEAIDSCNPWRLIPVCKYVGGYIDLPIKMTLQEILEEENSSAWRILSPSIECTLAGIRIYGGVTWLDKSSLTLDDENLSGLDLKGLSLRGFNLENVRLNGALFDKHTEWPVGFDYQNCGAIGPKANLQEANLQGADLRKADLTEANLENVDMTSANLSGAWFKRANLRGTLLRNANITRAIFREAKYDKNTQWPEGFDPKAKGAVLKED